MTTKKDFNSLIKLASQPLGASKGKPKKRRRAASYSGKKTRRRNSGGTSSKRRGKSR